LPFFFPISRFIANASAATANKLEPGAIVFIIVIALLGIGYGLLFVIRGLKISPKTIFILDTISLDCLDSLYLHFLNCAFACRDFRKRFCRYRESPFDFCLLGILG
jgi:hypothetical protein